MLALLLMDSLIYEDMLTKSYRNLMSSHMLFQSYVEVEHLLFEDIQIRVVRKKFEINQTMFLEMERHRLDESKI